MYCLVQLKFGNPLLKVNVTTVHADVWPLRAILGRHNHFLLQGSGNGDQVLHESMMVFHRTDGGWVKVVLNLRGGEEVAIQLDVFDKHIGPLD